MAGEMVHNIFENADSEFMDLERGMYKLSEHCFSKALYQELYPHFYNNIYYEMRNDYL